MITILLFIYGFSAVILIYDLITRPGDLIEECDTEEDIEETRIMAWIIAVSPIINTYIAYKALKAKFSD